MTMDFCFDAASVEYRSFPGWPQAVPAEIEVDAGTHHLHLRIAALSLAAAAPAEGAR